MKSLKHLYPISFLISFFFLFSCEEDEVAADHEFAAPTIAINSPSADMGLSPEVGDTITFSISVAAEAGLREVLLVNEAPLKAYLGTEKKDDLSYDYIVKSNDVQELTFKVKDTDGKITASSGITITPVGAVTGGGDQQHAAPSLNIITPETSASGNVYKSRGSVVRFTLAVAAEAGLNVVFLNDEPIKTYWTTNIKEDEIIYDYVVEGDETKEFIFTLEDAKNRRVSSEPIYVVPQEAPPYILVDFGGTSSSSREVSYASWDPRTEYTFNVTGDHTPTATAEAVASLASLSFAQNNPVPAEKEKVIKIVKEPQGNQDWDGYTTVIFNLQNLLDENMVEALPKYNPNDGQLIPGTKVIKVDAYYDATVNPDYTWNDVMAAMPNGYEVDLALVNYEVHATTSAGYDRRGYYISYTDYITAPNQWVTLTFNMAADDQTANLFYASGHSEAASPAEVDALHIRPAFGKGNDSNPLYFKNMRIVEAN